MTPGDIERFSIWLYAASNGVFRDLVFFWGKGFLCDEGRVNVREQERVNVCQLD
jgi:hypothetical protein